MIEITTHNFTTWDKLSSFIDENYAYFNYFRFRGHSEYQWKLESTLTRALKISGTIENKTELVQKHFDTFKLNLRGKCNLKLNEIEENELYAIGQHFGLYTPLLDWTNSPYVGLFFALQGNSESGKRCLWAINEYLINDVNESNKDFKTKIEFIQPLSNDNPRLVSQQGLFLRLPVEASLEELLKKTKTNLKGINVDKIIFDDTIKNDALANLNNMNINHLTLFPDIMGSSLHANYILEIDNYLKSIREKMWNKKK